ncbi:valine--tRNA ligase [Candidatus Woesearchaeota archaeon]|nr:valine--tRNA ligase [Candidatus Woesearchaeota archaeon]
MDKKRYDCKEAEPRILKFWEDKGIFKFNPEAKGPIYSVDTPPPTVSGKMHIGHAFQYTQFDIIARYKRLKGFNVFMPFGTDNNGLPTERLVEKLKGVKASKMGRQEFIDLCNKTVNEILPDFVQGWKNIGMSCDFSLCYSTIDDDCRKRSQWSFLDLVKKGRCYRKEAPSLWCPNCATAVAQVDCKDEEKDSTFNDIIFKINGKDVVIATTRPELLPACVAVFYHPSDDRYKNLKGKKAVVPLFNYEVPVLSDERVDPSKGTGIVMCCTFGDKNDAEWFKAYDLPLRIAIDKQGLMTTLCGDYEGLKIHDARKDMLKDLKAKGLLVGQKQIKHDVKVHERCNCEIEIINTKQWFIKYLDLKDEMIKWGHEPKWFPEHMVHRYDNWVNGLQWDWLISRQRFFGISFPVWYCEKCDTPIFAEESQLPVDPQIAKPVKKCKCGSTKFIPERDVQDTWPTSALTPQHAIGLVDKKYHKKLFPMSLRPQGQDIITFWLFNTTVKSHLHFNKNPWADVMISGFVNDPYGEKMSKSKGNIVEPEHILNKYSADAMRYWAASSKLGDDVSYQEKDVVAGDKLVTKLWNATKFVFMHLKNLKLPEPTETIDKWIIAKLSNTITEAEQLLDNYEYARAKLTIDNFFWQDFCDNYLELVKLRLYESKDEKKKASAQSALYTCISAILRLYASYIPFITEELYQIYLIGHEKHNSIHNSGWPKAKKIDEHAVTIGDAAVAILAAVRRKKSEAKLSMKAPVKLLRIQTALNLEPILDDLKATTSAEKIEFGDGEEEIGKDLFVKIEL